jgi:hypothetical protein
MAEEKSERPAAGAKRGVRLAAKEGDLTGPLRFRDPHTGEELETETATLEESAEAGFVGTKPKD